MRRARRAAEVMKSKGRGAGVAEAAGFCYSKTSVGAAHAVRFSVARQAERRSASRDEGGQALARRRDHHRAFAPRVALPRAVILALDAFNQTARVFV